MRQEPFDQDRRKFLKSWLAVAAGAAVFGSPIAEAAAPAGKQITLAGSIPTKAFGKTGHVLPILGHGGSAMCKPFIKAYGVELTSEEERVAMVRHGYDMGIRYFDTARVYGESESIVGRGLRGVRDDAYVATKIAVSDPARVRASVESSLKALDTDYVDCMQIHSPCMERVGAEGGMKVHAELEKLRGEGMIRFIGVTTHIVFEDVHKMISTGGFDQVLLAYGYFNKGMDTMLSHRNLAWREMCLAKAHELQMGIVAMKVLGANIMSHNALNVVANYEPDKLTKVAAAAIRWTASDPRVCMLNIGMSFAKDIDQDVEVLKGDLTLTNEDRMVLADFAGKAYESELVKKMKVT